MVSRVSERQPACASSHPVLMACALRWTRPVSSRTSRRSDVWILTSRHGDSPEYILAMRSHQIYGLCIQPSSFGFMLNGYHTTMMPQKSSKWWEMTLASWALRMPSGSAGIVEQYHRSICSDPYEINLCSDSCILMHANTRWIIDYAQLLHDHNYLTRWKL